jgi:hypothetical protein
MDEKVAAAAAARAAWAIAQARAVRQALALSQAESAQLYRLRYREDANGGRPPGGDWAPGARGVRRD